MSNEDRDAILKALVIGGGILVFGRFLKTCITFIGKFLISRSPGRFGFGAVSIGLSITMLVVGIGMLALHSGVGLYLPRYEATQECLGLVVSAAQLTFPLLIIATILLLAFAPTLSNRIFQDPSLTRFSKCSRC